MINPTESDIGRHVVYCGHAGERELGTISSFNDSYVFVRYHLGCTAAATKREQLEWAHGQANTWDRKAGWIGPAPDDASSIEMKGNGDD